MGYVSCVPFHIHMSGVRCHVSNVICSPFFFDNFVNLVGKGSVLKGAYPVFFNKSNKNYYIY